MKHVQINLNILIHKVKLQVRFPCSLLAFLKVQNEQTPFGPEVPLRVGQAYLELSASSRFSIYFDSVKNTFSQRKISICVYLKTSSGRVPAGAASIQPSMLRSGTSKINLSIEKCPDKSAFIETSITCNYLNQIQVVQSSEHIPELPIKEQSFSNRKNSTKSIGKNQNKQSQPDLNEWVNSPKISQHSEMKNSTDKFESLQRSNADRSISSYQLDAEQSSFCKKKVQKSDRQYTNYSPSNDYTSKIKLNELEKDLRNAQKKNEQSTMDLKTVTSKKDMLERTLKETEGQLKIYKEKFEDLQQTNDSLQKRFDYKETSYKQQIRHLTEKLTASENQKQQMIFEKNDIVSDFQEREKTLRLGAKEKEKQMIEDRNRIAKRNEQIAKQLAELQAKTGQGDLRVLELTRETTTLTKQNELLEDKCRSLLAQIDQLKEQLTLQKNKRSELEQTLGNNLELEDEKKKLKKKIAEQEQQISKHLKNISVLEANFQKQVKRTEEVQTSFKQKSNGLKNLQKDYQSLQKDIESFKKNVEQKDKKIEQLSNLKQGESSKVDALSEQLRQLEKKSSQELKTAKKQIKQKEAKIQALSKENEDHVQTINDYSNRIDILNAQLEQKNERLLKLQLDHDEILRNKSQLEQDIIELELKFQTQKGGKQELQISLKAQISEKEENIRRLQEAVKKMQANSAQQEEQGAYRISLLQQKIETNENEIKDNLIQIEKLKAEIRNLEQTKTQGQSNIEELQFTLKIKNNQISFLKDTTEKNHKEINDLGCQNKELSLNVQKLRDKQVQLQIEIQNLKGNLNEANVSGSGVQEKLNNYITSNTENITAFLKSLIDGSQNQFEPIHEDSVIQQLMLSSKSKVSQTYANFQQKIDKLESQLKAEQAEANQLRIQVEQRLQQNQELRNGLEEQLARNRENSNQFGNLIIDLKGQIQSLKSDNFDLSKELTSVKQTSSSLSEELETVNNALENKTDQNSSLKQRLEELEEQLKTQEKQFSKTQSRQSSKFQEESLALKAVIADIQEKLKVETSKSTDLTSKLNEKTKEYKELERKTADQIKKLGIENEKLNAQITKQAKQIEAKGSLNNRYSEIEADLRSKLEQASKENASLKELNETVRKRNEKGSLREKELEETIATIKNSYNQLSNKQTDLQKTLKERTAQFIASRQQNLKLDKEKQKLSQDLQNANSLIKVKEETQKKQQTSIKGLQAEMATLKEKIKGLSTSSSENDKKNQKEIQSLTEAKNKLEKQLEETKLKLETTQNENLTLSKNSQEANKQTTNEIKQLKSKNKELEEKILLLNKRFTDLQKSHSVEDEYLKPVRDSLQLLKGHMAEYARVGDQFESNKNKLLKMGTVKADLPNEKYVGDRIKDLSFAYNKLKLLILSSEMSQKSRNQVSEEIKRVQIVLDRVLRGQK